jgi:hypothetical protein
MGETINWCRMSLAHRQYGVHPHHSLQGAASLEDLKQDLKSLEGLVVSGLLLGDVGAAGWSFIFEWGMDNEKRESKSTRLSRWL